MPQPTTTPAMTPQTVPAPEQIASATPVPAMDTPLPFEYIEGWYNRRRNHTALNYRTLSQQESYFYTSPMAA